MEEVLKQCYDPDYRTQKQTDIYYKQYTEQGFLFYKQG